MSTGMSSHCAGVGQLYLTASPNDERYLVTYRGSFEMDCSVDAFGNSTCVQRHGVDLLPAVDFTQ